MTPSCRLPLAPKLLFGNALRETLFRDFHSTAEATRNRSFADGVPKQEFGNEKKNLQSSLSPKEDFPMFNRRRFLTKTLQGASLLSVGTLVPRFIADTARAAAPGKDNILVVLEMTGGNNGLNMVIPYADELYAKYRNTLRQRKEQVLKVNDEIGLHPSLVGMQQLLQSGNLAVVQGVGYPNPDRSHFESMDVWHSADHTRKLRTGWMARSAVELQAQTGGVPGMQIGPEKLPLALRGAPTSVASLNQKQPLNIKLGGDDDTDKKVRKQLLADLAKAPGKTDGPGMLQFVQRSELQTYSTVEQLQEILKGIQANGGFQGQSLFQKMELIAQLIQRGLGTRLFYLAIDGFDTHSDQAPAHQRLFTEVSQGIQLLFNYLQGSGHDKRVIVMTYSEFGRRVQENGSRGTDHGAGSCLFVAGRSVKGGAVGKHPSLSDLDQGDLKYHTDFRQVYATLLDGWLGCDSKAILGAKYERLPMLK